MICACGKRDADECYAVDCEAPMTCERCGHERDLDPGDRDNDPVAEYAAEKCVGEGGHLYTWGDAPLWPPKPPVER